MTAFSLPDVTWHHYMPPTCFEVVKTHSPNFFKPPTCFAAVKNRLCQPLQVSYIRFAVAKTDSLNLYRPPTRCERSGTRWTSCVDKSCSLLSQPSFLYPSSPSFPLPPHPLLLPAPLKELFLSMEHRQWQPFLSFNSKQPKTVNLVSVQIAPRPARI